MPPLGFSLLAVLGEAVERHKTETQLVGTALYLSPGSSSLGLLLHLPPTPHQRGAAAHAAATFPYLGCWGH